jgi:hypothetical protein
MPDLTMPAEIANPTAFVGATNSACIPNSAGQCSFDGSVSDSNVQTGVESGKICYRFGNVVPCP